MIIAIVTVYVIILTLLKLVYVLFQPKWLSPARFGPPSRMMMAVYYVVTLMVLALLLLWKLEFLAIDISGKEWSSTKMFQADQKKIVIVLGVAALATILHTLVEYRMQKKAGKSPRANQ